MDGLLILMLDNSLLRLSKKNWRRLRKVLDESTHSSKARRKLLNAITKHKATSRAHLLPASRKLTQLHETT
jgi:hypothetical protein